MFIIHYSFKNWGSEIETFVRQLLINMGDPTICLEEEEELGVIALTLSNPWVKWAMFAGAVLTTALLSSRRVAVQ